jgi:Protein of unknown function (DUF726)
MWRGCDFRHPILPINTLTCASAAGSRTPGIVENAVLIGTPVVTDVTEWEKLRREVVAGRLVNVYSRSDWVLSFIFRVLQLSKHDVAGIAPIDSDLVENVNVTSLVGGHLSYRTRMPDILEVLDLS